MAKFTAERIPMQERLTDSMLDRLRTIANTGNFDFALAKMEEVFKSSSAVREHAGCRDATDENKIHQCAVDAIFFFRFKKNAGGTDPFPAGKLNTEFAMFCTGKSKEEIEKIYLEYLKKAH